MKEPYSVLTEIHDLGQRLWENSNHAELKWDENGNEYLEDMFGRITDWDEYTTFTYKDFMSLVAIAEDAQQINISDNLVWQLLHASKGLSPHDIEWNLPFPSIYVQFNGIVSERRFFPHVEKYRILHKNKKYEKGMDGNDHVFGVFLHQGKRHDGKVLDTVAAYFESVSVNRVSWFDDSKLFNSRHQYVEEDRERVENKMQLARFGLAFVQFLNSQNVLIEPNYPPRHVQRQAKKEGREPPKPYYTCVITKTQYEGTGATGTGTRHGHMYSVRGHFRHLRSGRTVWVVPHFRGLAYAEEGVVSKIYRVKEGSQNG